MTWSPTAGKWQSHCSESSLPSTPHPSRLGAGASSQALPENGTYGLAKLGGPRPICPTCAVGVTHCLCRKLQLRSAPRHGSSAPARASDTAAGLALCLSSARHSSPLLRPPASPASTRCPEKTTSSTQSRLRDALESSLLMFEPHPATPTRLCPASLENLSDRRVPATLHPSKIRCFFPHWPCPHPQLLKRRSCTLAAASGGLPCLSSCV